MISKNTRRSTRPVESLEQFEILAKKGVDITRTADKLETVQELDNFDVTLSGDLELRKPILRQPIVSLTRFKVRKILPLYNPDFRLYIVSPDDNDDLYRIRIVKVSDGTSCSITYEWSNYYTYEEYTSGRTAFETAAASNNPIDWMSLELSHVSTSSIGTNAKVDLRSDVFKINNQIVIHDPDLILADAKVYRDIQFTKERDTNAWHVKIVMPYMNTFSADTGRFDANYALDNPYAVRDEYNTNITAVKGALPYVLGSIDAAGVPKMVSQAYSRKLFLRGNTERLPTISYIVESPDASGYSGTTGVQTDVQGPINISNYINVSFTVGSGSDGSLSTGTQTRLCYIHISTPASSQYTTFFNGECAVFGVGNGNDSELLYSDTYDGNVETLTVAGDITFPITERLGGYLAYKAVLTGQWAVIPNNESNILVTHLTENANPNRYYPVSVFGVRDDTSTTVYLKAFCSFTGTESDVYSCWEWTDNGTTWAPLDSFRAGGVYVEELATLYDSSGNVTEPDPEQTVLTKFYKIRPTSGPKSSITTRNDIVGIPIHVLRGAQVRFRLVRVDTSTETPKVLYPLGEAAILPVWGPETELLHSDTPIASSGKPLAYNAIEYTYGTPSVQPIIYASNAGELVRPESKIIDIPAAAADAVNTLIPWRDYMIAATDASIHLITKADSGYYTKIVNSSIGIPKIDSRCAVAVLNGVIFKSGNRIFQLYPNLYSGDDSILNISDISKPIAAEVFDSPSAFAFSTEEAYYLFLPTETNTVCLKYNYNLRVWTKFTYPVVLENYRVYSANNIRVFGTGAAAGSSAPVYGEFQIESPLKDHTSEAPEDTRDNLLYGDYISAPLASINPSGIGADVVTPIHYTLDTGQKIDKLVYTKQFTEVKFVFNTMSDKDKFPCTLYVQIDGDPHVHTINVNSDSPFWGSVAGYHTHTPVPSSSSDNYVGADDIISTLNVNSYTKNADLLGTFKQLILRYSGKGRSIRYILTGDSVYLFRIHSILSRYRYLNVKQ